MSVRVRARERETGNGPSYIKEDGEFVGNLISSELILSIASVRRLNS